MAQRHRPKIVVLGTMCHQPLAGMVMLFLQHLLGFERLGFETYYVEWHGRWVPNPQDSEHDRAFPRVVIGPMMRRFGLHDRWICRADHLGPGRTFGLLRREQLSQLYADAAAVVNVTGAHVLDDDQMRCPCRIYLETDPGIPQAKLQRQDEAILALVNAHTHHFTWAQNLRRADCLLPQTKLDYRLTRQPILLDLWECGRQTPGPQFTTVSKWEKRGKDFRLGEETYLWSKHHQFMRFVDLPRQTNQPLELALSGVSDDDRNMLLSHGWSVTDAWPISESLEAYRAYVAHSRGEFTIAKDQYVRLRTGWFSDRSACYLAAGRPVVTQDTAFDAALPTGEGLLAFGTADEAAAAFETINGDYERHSRAARNMAREYFDAERVLAGLLTAAGVDVPGRSAPCPPAAAAVAGSLSAGNAGWIS